MLCTTMHVQMVCLFVRAMTRARQHVGGSPATVTASTSEVCPATSEVVAPLDLRMAAGVPVDVFVAAKDAKGNFKSVGGDVFGVTWTHTGNGTSTNGMRPGCWMLCRRLHACCHDVCDTCVTGKVEDLGTGEYRCRLVATEAGMYKVAVTCKGLHVAGSPLLARVEPGQTDAGSCVASGPDMHHATAGQEVCRSASLANA